MPEDEANYSCVVRGDSRKEEEEEEEEEEVVTYSLVVMSKDEKLVLVST